MRGPGQNVKDCLAKAKGSALQAVEIYNRPSAPFRSGGYVVLMTIAWTSLFHAVFFKRQEKPYHRRGASKRFQRVDGDYRWWELSTCLDEYYKAASSPVRTNLEFFTRLRNKIEHRSLPDLDPMMFGECQAMLFNFDDFIAAEFGEPHRLAQSLYFSLQFRRAQPAASKSRPASGWSEVSTFVQAFRSTLTADVHQSNAYSFQVYLLPRIGNNRSSTQVAVEWVAYDADNPAEMDQYEKVAALIKERHVPVFNLGGYKASEVAPLVAAGIGRTFGTFHEHLISWRHYGVRPEKSDPQPTSCKTEYCYYDPVHKDYVYTQKWVDLLIKDLANEDAYNALFSKNTTAVATAV